jgi:hypothetical protein
MQITVTLQSLGGESAGIPRLFLNLRAKNASQFNLGIVRLTAEVHVAPAMNEYETKKVPFVGYGEQDYELRQLSMGSEQDWRFSLLLHPYALTVIERVRNKSDLFLAVQFFCTATNMKDNASPLTNLGRASVYAADHSGDYSYFKVPQSEWVKTLKDLGYGDFVLCEIPLRGVPVRVGLKKALAHLEDAWEHFSNGNDEETLMSCYKAFEFLAKQVKMTDPNQQAFEKILAGIEDEKKRKRLELLMGYVCRFFALSRHEEGQETVSFNRKDSEYAVILAQATLAYLAKSMSEESKILSRSLPQSK